MNYGPTELEARLALTIGLVLSACESWGLEEAQAADLALPVLRDLPGDALARGLVDALERGQTCYNEPARRAERGMRRDSLTHSLRLVPGGVR